MKLLVALILLSSFVIAQAPEKTIFIDGNNRSANEIRKEMVKRYGKKNGRAFFCLLVTNDPTSATYKMAVAEGDPRQGTLGQSPVAVSITDQSGVVVQTDDSRLGWSKMPYTASEKLCK